MRATLAVVVVVGLAGRAVADDGVALAKEAEKLAAGGDFAGAAAKFRAAYAADPRPEFLCNVGVAYQRAKVLPKAQLYLADCLRRGTKFDAKFVGQVRSALDSIEEKLRAGEFAPLDIVVTPPGATLQLSTFDPDERVVGARVVWVPLGNHTITITADGYQTDRRDVGVTAKTPQELRIELARTPIAKPPPGPREPIPTPAAAPARSLKLPAITTAATVAVAAVAGVIYLSARGDMKDAASPTITQDEYDDLVAGARTKQKASWALGGLAITGGVVSGYLWYRATRTPARVEVQPASGGASVSLHLRF